MSKCSKTINDENFLNKTASAISESLKKAFGPKTGFALLIFEFDNHGIGNYVSNVERSTMIDALRETADRLEKNQTIPPAIGSA
ncbi:hypothetical protein KAR91_74960 [Candidatus Pacearchaeota archaeon]|nr:hypothetical protein [Candidatus Pacearchaeota archaeon]